MTLSTREGRAAELRRLLEFGAGSATGARGFGYLDEQGLVDPEEGLQLWINTRMTHVFGLAVLSGDDSRRELVQRGVDVLLGAFHDEEHGGWYGRLGSDGLPVTDVKEMYGHAFVVLAAATASTVGADRADELLDLALHVVEQRFWDEEHGACRESWDRAWTAPEPYGGANSNMHAVEAFLAAGAVTGDPVWTDRAARIAARFVHGVARDHRWRLPEHFTADWTELLDYHQDEPAHPFRPFGVTVGHLLEWSRLMLHLETALDSPPDWLVDHARDLFDVAVAIGWAADGHPGLVYTVDWSDRPVVTARMHWVAAEAVMAAEALARRTSEARYADWRDRLWGQAARFPDPEAGGWWHELDPDGSVGRTVWRGKPDIYHAAQALLLPELPPTPSLVTSVAAAFGASAVTEILEE